MNKNFELKKLVMNKYKPMVVQVKHELDNVYNTFKRINGFKSIIALPFKIKVFLGGSLVFCSLLISLLFSSSLPFEKDFVLDLDAYQGTEAKIMQKMPQKLNKFSFNDGKFVIGQDSGIYNEVIQEGNVYLIKLSPDSSKTMTIPATIKITDTGIIFQAPSISKTKSGFILKEK